MMLAQVHPSDQAHVAGFIEMEAGQSPFAPVCDAGFHQRIPCTLSGDKTFSKDKEAFLELQDQAHTASEVKEVQRLKSLLLAPRHGLLEHLPVVPALPGGLDRLCHSLNQAFHAEKQHLGGACAAIDYNQPAESFARLDGAVRQLMSEYVAHGGQDWQQYMAFNPHHYVRHLIDACDEYELILICWGKGQVSRVHNHNTSHCWLTCLMGEVEEKHFVVPEDEYNLPKSPRAKVPEIPGVLRCLEPCPHLRPTGTYSLKQGSTGYVNDHISLHSVGCPTTVPEPGAVTLHLYSPPIRRVQLYEPDEDRVTTRVPGFFSVRGNRV